MAAAMVTVAVFAVVVGTTTPCTTDADCSLNGVCANHRCGCDLPWEGKCAGCCCSRPCPGLPIGTRVHSLFLTNNVAPDSDRNNNTQCTPAADIIRES